MVAHVVPEAFNGGPNAAVRESDSIAIAMWMREQPELRVVSQKVKHNGRSQTRMIDVAHSSLHDFAVNIFAVDIGIARGQIFTDRYKHGGPVSA